MMLSRVAVRYAALSARPTPSSIAAAPAGLLTARWQQQRSFAAKPPKPRPFPPPKQPAPNQQPPKPKGPSGSPNAPPPPKQAQFVKQAQHAKAAPGPNAVKDARSEKAGQASNPSEKEFSKKQAEFESPQNPDANKTSQDAPGQPQQPLPDLRHGIPSTFAEEFLKQQKPEKSTAEKPDPTGARHNVDITEAEVESTGSGSRGGSGSGSGSGGDGEFPKSAYETSQERRRNQMANYMYISIAAFAAACTVFLGRNWETAEEEKEHPDAPSGWGVGLFYNRIMARLSSQMGYYTEPTFPKLLPKVDPEPPYTLVVSLEDMLIHNEWSREHGWRTAKRPGMDYFLRYLCQYYEVVLFTSLPFMTADPVVRKLDPYHIISWPLFREATRYEKGEYVKDLSYLNRDLSRVILVDSKGVHAKHQPENAIILPPWKGDPKDRELVNLIPFLEFIASMSVPDVRKVIESFKDKHIPTEYARREVLQREEWERQRAADKAKRPHKGGISMLGGALGLKAQEDKPLTEQIRERGQKQYELLEKEIRENGEKWLKEMEAEEKKAQDEQMKSMRGSFFSFFGGPGDESQSGDGKPAGEGSKP